MSSHRGVDVNNSLVGRARMDQRERVRSLGRSGNRAAVRQLDSALSRAAGNGTLSLPGSCEDAGMQGFRDAGSHWQQS